MIVRIHSAVIHYNQPILCVHRTFFSDCCGLWAIIGIATREEQCHLSVHLAFSLRTIMLNRKQMHMNSISSKWKFLTIKQKGSWLQFVRHGIATEAAMLNKPMWIRPRAILYILECVEKRVTHVRMFIYNRNTCNSYLLFPYASRCYCCVCRRKKNNSPLLCRLSTFLKWYQRKKKKKATIEKYWSVCVNKFAVFVVFVGRKVVCGASSTRRCRCRRVYLTNYTIQITRRLHMGRNWWLPSRNLFKNYVDRISINCFNPAKRGNKWIGDWLRMTFS